MNNGSDLVEVTFLGLLPPLVSHDLHWVGYVIIHQMVQNWNVMKIWQWSHTVAATCTRPRWEVIFFYRYPVNNFKAHWWLGIDNVYLLNPAGSYCDNTITITLKHEVSSCVFTFTCVHHVLANWFNYECTKFRVLGCKLKVIFMLCALKAIVIIQLIVPQFSLFQHYMKCHETIPYMVTYDKT